MSWERKVSERTREVKKPKEDFSYGKTINDPSSSVSPTISGGLSFCPKCGSMMLESSGFFRCAGCGYSEYSETHYGSSYDDYAEEQRLKRKREQLIKEQETRDQMNYILNLMRQGKTRSQAAQSSRIPPYRVNHWYREGKLGTTKDTSHFYREVRSIEKDRERIEHQKQQEAAKQKEIDNIPGHMRSVVNQMNKGKTRMQAANYVGVSVSDVNDWYDKGSKNHSHMYRRFYNQVRAIELRQKNQSKTSYSSKGNKSKSKFVHPKDTQSGSTRSTKRRASSTNMIKCPHCGKKINKVNYKCPYCNKYRNSSTERTCPNCGKKLSNNDFNYCSSCGASLKTGKTKKKTTVKQNSSKDSSDDWIGCCIAVFVIFIILGFIMSFI